MRTVLKAENISKQYRLGTVGTGTLGHDLNRWWHLIRGKDDPYLTLGAVNQRNIKAKEEYVWALQNIDFEVEQGEVLGIIGKNGAGKSTLLKLLSRVTSPTTGTIKTRGRIASLLEIGTGFHPELTGKENIFMNGAVLGMTKSEIKRNLDEIIAFSGCEKYIDTPVKRYSSGMTVRLGFAVAAHLEPEILVVDEVLAVGDAEFQQRAIGKMQDLAKGKGRTVLFVSHNMASVQNLCTKVAILENGECIFIGSPENSINKYLFTTKTDFNKNFIPNSHENLEMIRLKEFRITSEIKTGVPFSYQFNISSKREMPVDIAIGFKDSKEAKIFQIFSGHSQQKIRLQKGNNMIEGEVKVLPLVSGSYSLSLWIGSQYQVFQFYPDSIRINVEEGGLVEGDIAPYRQYPVITNSNWFNHG